MTPDCQELDWHDTRTDTRPRDPPSVHPALQCLPSIAARRPAAQPRSAPLTVRDGQAGPARCPSCAWRPAPRPRPRSVCHVVVVGLVPLRLLFALPQCSWDRSQTHGFRDRSMPKPMGSGIRSIPKPMKTHGFGHGSQIDIKPMGSEFSGSSSGDSKDDSSTQGRRGSKLDASWMCSGSSSRQTGADNGRVGA